MVKIPTFNTEAQRTSESGNIQMSLPINPSAASAQHQGQMNMANAVGNIGSLLGSVAKKEKEILDVNEATQTLARYTTVIKELETASLSYPLGERANWFKAEHNKLQLAVQNGGSYKYKVLLNEPGSAGQTFYWREWKGKDGFVKPRNRAVKRVLTESVSSSFLSSYQGIQKAVTVEAMAQRKLNLKLETDRNIETMLKGVRINNKALTYEGGMNVFGLDLDPDSETYYEKLVAEGVDPAQGVTYFEHAAAVGLLTNSEAQAMEVEAWQDYLKDEIGIKEALISSLPITDVGAAYQELIDEVKHSFKYNNQAYGIDNLWVAKKVAELTKDRTRELNTIDREFKGNSANVIRFEKEEKANKKEEILSILQADIDAFDEDEILRFQVDGWQAKDPIGNLVTVKLDQKDIDYILKIKRGQVVTDEALKQDWISRIYEEDNPVELAEMKMEISSEENLSGTDMIMLQAQVSTRINSLPQFLRINKSRTDLKQLIGDTSVPTDEKRHRSWSDRKLIDDTLSYFDGLVWSGKNAFTADEAKSAAYNYYTYNSGKSNRKFAAVYFPPEVLKDLGPPGQWTIDSVTTARVNLNKRITENSFPLGVMVKADDKLRALQDLYSFQTVSQVEPNKNVGQKSESVNLLSRLADAHKEISGSTDKAKHNLIVSSEVDVLAKGYEKKDNRTSDDERIATIKGVDTRK